MRSKPATIPSGTDTSAWVDCTDLNRDPDNEYGLVGVSCPSNIDSITSLTFEVTYDDAVTVLTLKDATGSAVSATVAALADVALPPTNHAIVRPKMRIKSNAVTTADRTFNLNFRKV